MPEEWTKSNAVTLLKKGNLKECSNQRTSLSLINHMCKMLLIIISNRLRAGAESRDVVWVSWGGGQMSPPRKFLPPPRNPSGGQKFIWGEHLSL